MYTFTPYACSRAYLYFFTHSWQVPLATLITGEPFQYIPSLNSVSNSKTMLNNRKFCPMGLRPLFPILVFAMDRLKLLLYIYKYERRKKKEINEERPSRNLPNQACCSPWTSIARPKSANLTAAPFALLARSRFSGWKETRAIVAGHPVKEGRTKRLECFVFL